MSIEPLYLPQFVHISYSHVIMVMWHALLLIIGQILIVSVFLLLECCKMQYRGGSELLVEAGDQRRVIPLPSDIQGTVAGAKFVDQSLVITMR